MRRLLFVQKFSTLLAQDVEKRSSFHYPNRWGINRLSKPPSWISLLELTSWIARWLVLKPFHKYRIDNFFKTSHTDKLVFFFGRSILLFVDFAHWPWWNWCSCWFDSKDFANLLLGKYPACSGKQLIGNIDGAIGYKFLSLKPFFLA